MSVDEAAACDALARQVRSRRAGKRLEAAQRLRDQQADTAVPLLRRLLADRRTNVQSAAADSLRTMSDPRGRAVLLDALQDDSEWTRVIAAMSLAVEGEPLAWPVLERALSSEDIDVFGPTMEGLWRFEQARARAITEKIAREACDQPFLREMAARILGSEGTSESLPALHAAMTDRSRHVRRAATDAIAAIRARSS